MGSDSSSDSSSLLVLGKMPRTAGNGKWHLFRKEGQGSVCGRADWDRLHERVEPRSFNPEEDSLDEVAGLGQVCKLCREYITGSLEENSLPQPEEGRKKKTNLVEQWKDEEKKSAGEIYG